MKTLEKTIIILIALSCLCGLCGKEEDPEITTCTPFSLGREYKTVQIGDQCWMAENLDFNAGSGCWEAPDPIEGWGRYYTWEAAKRVCPDGWHIPTKADWEQMMQYISDQNGGYERKDLELGAIIWYEAAVHLKTNEEWISNKGTNDYGFAAMPTGYRRVEPSTGDVIYSGYNHTGMWWSSSNDGTSARHCFIDHASQDFRNYATEAHLVNHGITVRYIKD